MSEEKSKPKKRPTAQKRLIQDQKKHLQNKIFKSKVKTAYRNALEEKDAEKKKSLFVDVQALLDKAVNKKIFKRNKSARLKSRLHSKIA